MFSIRSGQAGDAPSAYRGSKIGVRAGTAGDSVPAADIHRDRSDLGARAAVDFDLNSLALKIRGGDRKIDEIEQHVEKMKSELEGIVKNYPPFPEGSEERVRMLKTFKAFRDQIASLTLPPPSDQDDFRPMVDPFLMLPGEVLIRELSEGATDEEIYAAIDTLHAAKDRLEDVRSDMMSDAMNTIAFAKRYPGYGEEIRKNMSAEMAQQTSSEVREALAKEAGSSLAGAQSRLFVSVEKAWR